MKILKTYSDGSQSTIFEIGDRVRLTEDYRKDDWIAKPGDYGYVVGFEDGIKEPGLITFLKIRTDDMIAGNWGTITVPPWNVEYINKKINSDKSKSKSSKIKWGGYYRCVQILL